MALPTTNQFHHRWPWWYLMYACQYNMVVRDWLLKKCGAEYEKLPGHPLTIYCHWCYEGSTQQWGLALWSRCNKLSWGYAIHPTGLHCKCDCHAFPLHSHRLESGPLELGSKQATKQKVPLFLFNPSDGDSGLPMRIFLIAGGPNWYSYRNRSILCTKCITLNIHQAEGASHQMHHKTIAKPISVVQNPQVFLS